MPKVARTDAQRKRAHAGKGILQDRQISSSCRRCHTDAIAYFFWLAPYLDLRWAKDCPAWDVQVCAVLECLHAEGEAKARAGDLISGLRWHYQTRHVLSGAWRKYHTWNTLEPNEQTPPLPVAALFAAAGRAEQLGQHLFADCIFLGFHCFLRTGEMIEL